MRWTEGYHEVALTILADTWYPLSWTFYFFNTTKKKQEHETLQVCTRDQNKGFKMVAVESTVHCWSYVIVLSFFLYASYF